MSNNGFSPAQKSNIFFKTDGNCAYCGCSLDPFRNWEIEHVIPKSRGGTDDASNLVPACRRCNSIKSARSLDEFREHLNDIAIEHLDRVINQIENFGITGQQEEVIQLIKKSAYIIANNNFTFFIDKSEQET
jgi:Zn-finger protein